MRFHTSIALSSVALLVPMTLLAATRLDQTVGSLSGRGTTPSHTFEVNASEFEVQLSDPDDAGSRDITVRVPVSAITTGNSLRDMHMRESVFKGFLDAGKDMVVFSAKTDAPLSPGHVAISGQLSILGVSRTQEVTIDLAGSPLVATGSASVDLANWGIDTPGMGPMKVEEKVPMNFQIRVP